MARERLILIGFMGVGKSTVGPEVAQRLGTHYYDTDERMETAGVDVPELVRTNMAAFRKLEADTLREILAQEPGIISTGGGIVSTAIGRNALLEVSYPVIWMRAPFEDLERRVSQDSGRERPLFKDPVKARELYDERLPWYEETSNHKVDASDAVGLGEIVTVITQFATDQ